MSPEIVTGDAVDHRSDIFAVGTLLYEMLTLTRLFMGRSQMQTMANVRSARITKRMRKHDYIPTDVQRIIRLALARRPDDRYGSADEMERDIRDLLFEMQWRVDHHTVTAFLYDLFPERVPRRAPLRGQQRARIPPRRSYEDVPTRPERRPQAFSVSQLTPGSNQSGGS